MNTQPGVRDGQCATVENACVAIVQRGETTIGPVAVDGRTITLVARTRALHLGKGPRAALGVRARPAHVEVLDADGRRQVVRVRDVELTLMSAIAAVGAACTLGALAWKKARSR